MGKKPKTTTIATKGLTGGLYAQDCFNNVKKSFDGLRGHVSKLPESKEKSAISQWVGDTYLAAADAILSVSRMLEAPTNA